MRNLAHAIKIESAMCKVCDEQPASHEGDHPDWCAGCNVEFGKYLELRHSACATCLTPLSCRVLKQCSQKVPL